MSQSDDGSASALEDLNWRMSETIRAVLEHQSGIVERLRPLMEGQAEAIRRWNEANQPMLDAVNRIREQIAAATKPLVDPEWLKAIQREDEAFERLERAGWLAHSSSPVHLIQGALDDDALDAAVSRHYGDHWDRVATDMLENVRACRVDDEAKDTFAEAVTAHGAGLYRCAPRLLFPELERVARIEVHGGAMDKMASQGVLIEAIGGLSPGELAWSGVAGMRFYRKLTEHMYAHLKNQEAVGRAAADPVPNRHAALHGYVPYATSKSSFNALASTEYLLMAVSSLKDAAEDRADGDGSTGATAEASAAPTAP